MFKLIQPIEHEKYGEGLHDHDGHDHHVDHSVPGQTLWAHSKTLRHLHDDVDHFSPSMHGQHLDDDIVEQKA